MVANKPLDLSALAEHRRIVNLWRGTIALGLALFGFLLLLSHFVLNAPDVADNTHAYKQAVDSLGLAELAGMTLSVVGLLRYMNLKAKAHIRIFASLIKDNDWTHRRKFDQSIVASTLLGAGTNYEELYEFGGAHGGHPFSCVVFRYDASDSRTRSFICLRFRLPKSYPTIAIDNRLNDHRLGRRRNDLPDQLPGGVSLSLEGDFDQHYRVSTTKGREQEALEVLSPDFMAALEDRAAERVDIEIGGKDLFLIYDAAFYSERNLTRLFDVADLVLGNLKRLSKTWLASGKSEEEAIDREAQVTRHQLVFRTDLVSLAIGIAACIIFVALMISAAETPYPAPPPGVSPEHLRIP